MKLLAPDKMKVKSFVPCCPSAASRGLQAENSTPSCGQTGLLALARVCYDSSVKRLDSSSSLEVQYVFP
jgi:hypothetical protein